MAPKRKAAQQVNNLDGFVKTVTKKAKLDESSTSGNAQTTSHDESSASSSTAKATTSDTPATINTSATQATRETLKAHLDTATYIHEMPGKIATREAASAVDANNPLSILEGLMGDESARVVEPGECVVYWMRMEDMRSESVSSISLV